MRTEIFEERLLRWLCGLKQNKVKVPAEILKNLYPEMVEKARRMECPFCGRKFNYRGVVKTHISVMHPIEWRKVVDEVKKLTELFYANVVKFRSGNYRVRIKGVDVRGRSYEEVLKKYASLSPIWLKVIEW